MTKPAEYRNAGDLLPPPIARFVDVAESCKPELIFTPEKPIGLIEAEKDEKALLGWKAVCKGSVEDMEVLKTGDSVIIDFGGHRTGYFSFDLQSYKFATHPADAPCRLRLVFGEILSDVAEEFEPYKSWMCKSWLPDEIITVDWLPQPVKIARRHAFRYVRIEVVAVSMHYGVRIENPIAHAVTSCTASVPPLSFASSGSEISDEDKTVLRRIDEVALRTLRNCMQTVYEDGPRRDMRLWIGDLRLQALANYKTFKDTLLAKRCLYLFAGTPFHEDGRLGATVYEHPQVTSGGQSIVDFTLIYAAALLDYVEFSGDKETGKDLFSVALRQAEIAVGRTNSEWVYHVENIGGMTDFGAWHFVDWEPTLDKVTSIHCIIIFSLKSLLSLSKLLGLPVPTIATPASSSVPITEIIEKMTASALSAMYDPSLGVFVSGPEKQISWASNAWAVMAGVTPSQEVAAEALRKTYQHPETVIAMTPYLHHYLVEAFVKAGLEDLAVKHIKDYWGSMVTAGAETFWEAWNPKLPTVSPYQDFHINSFCHAWSCTPALLLRQLGFA